MTRQVQAGSHGAIRRFRDRREAGVALAQRLERLRHEDPVVLALPRGGVPVAFEVAQALRAPLDVMVVRKLGVPFQPELGMGAIGEGEVRVLDPETVRVAQVTADEIAAVEARERAELERRVHVYRGDRPMTSVEGRTVIIVDDGIATGGTARAAVADRTLRTARVGSCSRCRSPPRSRCASCPRSRTRSSWSRRRPRSSRSAPGTSDSPRSPTTRCGRCSARPGQRFRRTTIRAGDDPSAPTIPGSTRKCGCLQGDSGFPGHLTVPRARAGPGVVRAREWEQSAQPAESVRGRVVSTKPGSRRCCSTSCHPTKRSNGRTSSTSSSLRFGSWLRPGGRARQPSCDGLAVGYFGASTGAGAALWAASEDPTIAAVVSRGGRPDLAGQRLHAVGAPTLLIVGSDDTVVRRLNEDAAARLRCEHRIAVVPGATHLFEEPGTLDTATSAAQSWFVRHLSGVPATH